MRIGLFLGIFAIIAVGACTETTTTSSGVFGEDVVHTRRSLLNEQRELQSQAHSHVKPGALARGNDQFVNPSRAARTRQSKAVVIPKSNELVEISLVNASLRSAAQAVLGDTLGLSFTVESGLEGDVTVQSTGAIPKSALYDLFEAALSSNGAKVEKSGKVYKVVAARSGSRAYRLAQEKGATSGPHIVVAPLKFISSKQMAKLLEPLISDGLSVQPDTSRNLIMLSGRPEQLEAALDALNLFDVDVLAGKSVALVELNSAEPDAIADELKLIFENEEGGNLEGVIEFVPNKRLGSVLIITSRARYLPRAQKWVRELDRTASAANRYIETYELQNRTAPDVANILSQLLAGSSSSSETGSGTGLQTSSRVAADQSRNALLIRATRSEHREIALLLNEIDSSPQQVMLEATIAEVTLNDELSLGVRWFFQNGNFDFSFSDAASGATGGSFPGFSAVFGSGGDAAAINALAGVTNVKIISSPTLMVLDNEEAILQIGDQVPVATQSSTETSSDAPTITTIEYRDTGVILKVKPAISRNGRVVLDVTQEISSVSETQTSGIDSPTIRQRKIATNVLLNDGTTLALGGLVQETNTKTITKVPGLGDAPVVGGLFRKTESSKRRSELLILIRPRVINTAQDARSITQSWRAKLAGANSILGTGLGGASHTISDVLP